MIYIYSLVKYLYLAYFQKSMIISKPLYVALAQCKEERRARLQVNDLPGNNYDLLTIGMINFHLVSYYLYLYIATMYEEI